MLNRSVVLRCFGVFGLGVIATGVSPVHAAWRKLHNIECNNYGENRLGSDGNYTRAVDGKMGMTINAAGEGGSVVCSVRESDGFPKSSIQTATVYLYDNSVDWSPCVAACRTFAPSNGSACGTPVDCGSNSGTGSYEIDITDLSQLTDYGFGYIWVELNPHQQLKGIILKDY